MNKNALLQICRRFCEVEQIVCRAASLTYCLPHNPNLVDEILVNAEVHVKDEDRASVAAFFAEGKKGMLKRQRSREMPGTTRNLKSLLNVSPDVKEYMFQLIIRRAKPIPVAASAASSRQCIDSDSKKRATSDKDKLRSDGNIGHHGVDEDAAFLAQRREYVCIEPDIMRFASISSVY
mmetsp:Transcript_6930/g.10765  ORF Transcript_6930/g.10765 Transcript_6930/m.10765 type:complete len:178 (-) Transcript_6930:172-705(-)